MMAAQAMTLNTDSVIDAEFETVLPAMRTGPVVARTAHVFPEAADSADDLSLLRANDAVPPKNEQPEQLTPAFLFFTFVAALAVFWVSGGHALLY